MTTTLLTPELTTLSAITTPTDQMLWDLIDTELLSMGSAAAAPALTGLLQTVGPKYELAAASAAVDLYTARRVDAGLAHILFKPSMASLVTAFRWESLAMWALGTSVTVGAGLAIKYVPWDVVVPKVVGGVHRTVADAFRHTTMQNSINDDASRGWKRTAEVGACDFCLMLADRGGVYTTQTAKFAAHDHCKCSADAEFRTPGEAEAFVYQRSQRTQQMANLDAEYAALNAKDSLTDAEKSRMRSLRGGDRIREHNARAREWIALEKDAKRLF